ncbi:MAG: hypothetical protein LW808_000335 [Verrucomicrobiota bacterium]|nr:MAG: hypothetical protein LW808_000335 [Verrucomicrobiota bacterium]
MAAMENVNKLPIPSSDPRIRALLESPETIASSENKKTTPSGYGQIGGSGISDFTKAEKGAIMEAADNLETLKQNLNVSVNIMKEMHAYVEKINGTSSVTRSESLSTDESTQLNRSCMECLQSSDPKSIRNLANNINQIIDSGLPTDRGSLGDIMTAILILQLKSAMEGKQANREMSAEMASTIYQKSKEIASMILEKGKIAFDQAIAGAITGLVGTAFSSGMTIAGTIKANRKQDNGTQEINTGFDSTRNFRLDDISRNTLIQKYNAIGGLGQAIASAMKGVIDAICNFDIAKLESSIRDLEALNRLNENAQQSVKDVVESFISVAKFCLQMMKEINSLENQGIMTVQNKIGL